jgi:phage baseplate assembly protein W
MIFYSDVNRQDPLVDEKIYDVEAVLQSLDTLINTTPGERLFLPDFGIDLEKFLFEPMDWKTKSEMFDEIFRKVGKYEPRAEINTRLSGIEEDPINHTISIDLVFSIKGKRYQEYVYQTVLTDQQKERYYEL